MYFLDLSEYTYSDRCAPDGMIVLNIGWLDESHDFARGEVPAALLEKFLRRCVAHRVNQMRGRHHTPLLQGKFDPYESACEIDGQRVELGSAEIRVIGLGNMVYACPTLMYCYMKFLNYMPPAEFVDALARLPS